MQPAAALRPPHWLVGLRTSATAKMPTTWRFAAKIQRRFARRGEARRPACCVGAETAPARWPAACGGCPPCRARRRCRCADALSLPPSRSPSTVRSCAPCARGHSARRRPPADGRFAALESISASESRSVRLHAEGFDVGHDRTPLRSRCRSCPESLLFTLCRFSSASADWNSTPFFAPTPVPTMMATGVASPSAHRGRR